jgi:hypothetical protein
MTLQGKQVRAGAREGFAYNSMKLELALLANGNRYKVHSKKHILDYSGLQKLAVLFKWQSNVSIEYIALSQLCPSFLDTYSLSLVCVWEA